VAEHDLSVRRVSAAVKLSRAAYYRDPGRDRSRDEPVIEALNETVSRYPKWGFWKCYDRLRLDGKPWNHKRVLRIYREMRLNLPRRTKKRVPVRERQTLEVPEAANAIWAASRWIPQNWRHELHLASSLLQLLPDMDGLPGELMERVRELRC
jgi:putative transposase